MGAGADYFVKKHIHHVLAAVPDIDTLLLACTHYPPLKEKIQMRLPAHVKLLAQGEIVAQSLYEYLQRHPDLASRLTKKAERVFYTTDSAPEFERKATLFYGESVHAAHVEL